MLPSWLLLLLLASSGGSTLPTQPIEQQQPTSLWRTLSKEEVTQWYSQTDICMLQSEDRAVYPQVVRSEHCATFSQGERKLQCGVGMGHRGAPCFPPFVSRPSFYKGKWMSSLSLHPVLSVCSSLIVPNIATFSSSLCEPQVSLATPTT